MTVLHFDLGSHKIKFLRLHLEMCVRVCVCVLCVCVCVRARVFVLTKEKEKENYCFGMSELPFVSSSCGEEGLILK